MNTDHAAMQRLRRYLAEEGLCPSARPTYGPLHGQITVGKPDGSVVGVRIEGFTRHAVLFDPESSSMVQINEIERWPLTGRAWAQNLAKRVRVWLEQRASAPCDPETPAPKQPRGHDRRGISIETARAIIQMMHTAQRSQDAGMQLGERWVCRSTVDRCVRGTYYTSVGAAPRGQGLDPERAAMLAERDRLGLKDTAATRRLRMRLAQNAPEPPDLSPNPRAG